MSAHWTPVQVSIDDTEKLISVIKTAGREDGIFVITDIADSSLLSNVRKVFDRLQIPANETMIDELNRAYTANLVFKDSAQLQKQNGFCPLQIDNKKAFDLSPARISIINGYNPALLKSLGPELSSSLNFFDSLKTSVVTKILSALCTASGVEPMKAGHVNFNYRMLDYQNVSNKAAPRCGEHRDFGLFTLIFQDETGGLQIQREDGQWHPVPADGHSAICLFGWSAQIITNRRIKATKHRVVSAESGLRRNSAVLFVAPNPGQVLVPAVKPNEKRHYANIKVSELKEQMRNAWQMREGTLSKNGQVSFQKNVKKSQADVLDTITL